MLSAAGLQPEAECNDEWSDLCSVWFDDPREGIIAVLVLYSDASYNQPTGANPNPSLFYTVGSYLGEVDNWRKFRKEWRAELREWGITDFHANKFERARGVVLQGKPLEQSNPYYGWTVDDFDDFITRLHKVLRRKDRSGIPRLQALGFSVKKTDFDSFMPAELKDDPGCQSYYMFCVATNMQHAAQLATFNSYQGKIHYVFASGDKEGSRLDKFFHSLWEDETARNLYRLSKSYSRWGYDIASAAGEPALQAADVAAYEFNKLAVYFDENNITDPSQLDPSVLRKSLLSLARPPLSVFPLLFSGDRMKRAFTDMAAFKKKHGSAYAQNVNS